MHGLCGRLQEWLLFWFMWEQQRRGLTLLLTWASVTICVLFAAVSAEVCPEQRRVHALPQSPSDPSAHPGHLSRQRDRGEHGGVAQGNISLYFLLKVVCICIRNIKCSPKTYLWCHVSWQEVGMPADYVNKLARMFQDIKVSEDLNQSFKEMHKHNKLALPGKR